MVGWQSGIIGSWGGRWRGGGVAGWVANQACQQAWLFAPPSLLASTLKREDTGVTVRAGGTDVKVRARGHRRCEGTGVEIQA